jgi:hypothetical protein
MLIHRTRPTQFERKMHSGWDPRRCKMYLLLNTAGKYKRIRFALEFLKKSDGLEVTDVLSDSGKKSEGPEVTYVLSDSGKLLTRSIAFIADFWGRQLDLVRRSTNH